MRRALEFPLPILALAQTVVAVQAQELRLPAGKGLAAAHGIDKLLRAFPYPAPAAGTAEAASFARRSPAGRGRMRGQYGINQQQPADAAEETSRAHRDCRAARRMTGRETALDTKRRD